MIRLPRVAIWQVIVLDSRYMTWAGVCGCIRIAFNRMRRRGMMPIAGLTRSLS
jgi:hypothetical protein